MSLIGIKCELAQVQRQELRLALWKHCPRCNELHDVGRFLNQYYGDVAPLCSACGQPLWPTVKAFQDFWKLGL
jgi:uncharacterized protein (DUF983 family)